MVMKYKMIAIDMDGTLLNDKKEVSKENKIAIKKASELGVKIVVCTGRIFTSARFYASLIGTAAPIVASNGAYIREKDENRIIYKKAINKEILPELINVIESFGLTLHLYTNQSIYTKELVNLALNYIRWNEVVSEGEKVEVKVVKDFEDVINSEEILKVALVCDDIELLRKLRSKISEEFDVSIVSSNSNNIEIMAKGISKGNAVKILADYFGYKREEVICVGDSENDISMIEYAGLGVAMGNGIDYVKSIADYITDTNERDGVAKVINKFILNE